ncbi:MAG: AMP-binding protein, partial [Bacteroidota bacterium]
MSNYHIKHLEEYFQVYRKSVRNPESFWEEIAEEHFVWRKKWDNVLHWDFSKPEVIWFQNAKLNITENCLDRHLPTRAEKTAIIFEPNDPKEEAQHITYRQLHEKVSRMANVLKEHGIRKGDRVCIYLPMIPELAVSVLACARIGAIHSVVFAGFSSIALSTRVNDCDCKMVITSDGSYRGGKTI